MTGDQGYSQPGGTLGNLGHEWAMVAFFPEWLGRWIGARGHINDSGKLNNKKTRDQKGKNDEPAAGEPVD